MASELLEDGGESYFASVSDLMVGILFVFLLMLTVLALNFRDAEDEAARERVVAEAQSRRNADLRALLQRAVEQLREDVGGREAARARLLAKLASTLQSRGVSVLTDPNSGVLRLPEDVLFEKGHSELKLEAAPRLRILAETLANTLPCFSEHTMPAACGDKAAAVLETALVEGHSSSERWAPPKDSQDENDRLSTERALAVFKALRQAQPSLGMVQNAQGQALVGVSGYGDRRPRPDALRPSAEDYAKNRRIDLRFVLSARASSELRHLLDEIEPALKEAP